MYQGLEVGQLTKLDLNPGGKVTGEMTVDPSVVTLLRENTRIELRNPKLSLSDANLSALLTGKTFEFGTRRWRATQRVRCCARRKSTAA
ncbi:mce-like protein [Escherichia coli]|nr:mce-like protein [Escherichia coli]